MPTQTHVSDNSSNGYVHLNTATCGVRGLLKFYLGRSSGLATGSDNETSLLIALLSLWIMWLDDATHPNCPHQKKSNGGKRSQQMFLPVTPAFYNNKILSN
jgi:hypothetical protein